MRRVLLKKKSFSPPAKMQFLTFAKAIHMRIKAHDWIRMEVGTHKLTIILFGK
jgi:hypothetical protein